jgi:hypothetical protein
MRSGGLEWRHVWSFGVFTARTLALSGIKASLNAYCLLRNGRGRR